MKLHVCQPPLRGACHTLSMLKMAAGLLQDLAVVVLLMLIPLLAPSESGSAGFSKIARALGLAAVKVAPSQAQLTSDQLSSSGTHRDMEHAHRAQHACLCACSCCTASLMVLSAGPVTRMPLSTSVTAAQPSL